MQSNVHRHKAVIKLPHLDLMSELHMADGVSSVISYILSIVLNKIL